MKILDVPQSGKLGLSVSYPRRSGQFRRTHVVPRDPRTPSQLERRKTMKLLRQLWGTLADRQFAGWNATARKARSSRRLNQSGPLNGYLLFLQLNCRRAALSLPPLLDPPALPHFDLDPVDGLTITRTNGSLAIRLRVAGRPSPHLVLRGAKPRGAGCTYADHFTLLGVLPEPVGGLSDITALYVAKHGPPPAGSRVFLEIVQQINGWQNLPSRFSARVPAP